MGQISEVVRELEKMEIACNASREGIAIDAIRKMVDLPEDLLSRLFECESSFASVILERIRELLNLESTSDIIKEDEKIETIKNALNQGYSIESIQKIVSLSKSDVETLIQRLTKSSNVYIYR